MSAKIIFVVLLAVAGPTWVQACPEIVSREGWGARPPKSTSELATPVPNTVIHHTVMGDGQCNNRDECVQVMREIQDFHMDSNGWDDIGYSFLIGGDGLVYEGRGWYRVGAHAPGQNTISHGFSLIGDFMLKLPSELQMNVTKELIACGIDTGVIITDYTIYGHRDVTNTDCPGDLFYEELRTWPNFHDSTD